MSLSVIIPTYKRPYDLERLLVSLYQQIYIPEEILIIIGPNDKKSIQIVESWQSQIPSMHFLQAQKPSVVHALNLGLYNAKNDIICLLDDDVSLPSTWSLLIKTAYERDDNLGAYGGPDKIQLAESQFIDISLAKKVGVFSWDGTLIGNHHCGIERSPSCVQVLKGVNLSFRRSAFIDMKIEPALQSQGAEVAWEIDICQQIKLTDYKIVYDNANYVLHYAGSRLMFDNRTDMFSPSWPNRIYNEALVTSKFRPITSIIFYIFKSFFIGSRLQPGILWAFLHLHNYGIRILKLPIRNIVYMQKGLTKGFNCRKAMLKKLSYKINKSCNLVFLILTINNIFSLVCYLLH